MLVAFADTATPAADFSEAERDRVAQFRYKARRRDWIAGRKALKLLLGTLNRSSDTLAITFPDPQVSLSHGDGAAFAVGTTSALRGIGIDYEPLRAVNSQVAKWFLTAREIVWLNEQCSGDVVHHMVRLWTIKEAAFKSHPNNAGMSLRDLCVMDLANRLTNAVTTSSGADIQVACRRYGRGYLSIAICQESS